MTNRHGTRPPHITYEDDVDHHDAIITEPKPRSAPDASDCIPCLSRVAEEPGCNWGLGDAMRAKWEAVRREAETLNEDSLSSVYQLSFCHPDKFVDLHHEQKTSGRCQINSERREQRAAAGLPCMPDGLIREVRPDTQLEVVAATRFDHPGHSMGSDPCDRNCRCELNLGQMMAHVKTLQDRQAAAAEKNIV